MERLRTLLKKIDGRGYKAYKELKGSYQFNGYRLTLDHVQGDPFAQASRISIHVPSSAAPLPSELCSGRIRKTAAEDFLARSVARAIQAHVKGHRGIGKSGEMQIETSGQQILVRNSVLIDSEGVEARLTVGLPAAGRTIMARDVEEMFFRELPEVVSHGLYFENLDQGSFQRHVESAEDQDCLRGLLLPNNLAAFVADNSLLPRQSGIDDRPLKGKVIPFVAPESLACTLVLPNRGKVRGMGIPRGVTLIVGGGFHGKSTLLHALERGVYNHIPGDGRELVATDPSAVKVRAEDNRVVSNIDISPFIDRLPFARNTTGFSTENASGSTSQAANIIEALEDDAALLLIDEDTSATNFMIRDERMQRLVVREKEPITPFLFRVREMYHVLGVSTILVMGGSGDYFAVSDTVIMMDSYRPEDVTLKAQALVDREQVQEKPGDLPPIVRKSARRPDAGRLNPVRGKKDVYIETRGIDTLLYGRHEIDLSKVEQLIDIGQTRAIGLIIHYYARNYADRAENLTEGLRLALKDVEEKGLDILSPWKTGTLALPRLHEVAAAINRIRAEG
ncbi:MAG: ABC-ATPase domain-containing protein [Proteobacteria bacterium]|nr:ABC-ATPase domain-containing protein [Pseudomonadota bacterium]MBU1649288.1 ABC-ATPase domain-containing protein [Pseudomonadota bacterium]